MKKFFSLILSLAMILSSFAISFAEDGAHAIYVTYADGSQQTYTNTSVIRLLEYGTYTPEKVTFNDGVADVVVDDFSKTVEVKLTAGTVITTYTKKESDVTSLYMQLKTELKEAVHVNVSGIPGNWTVHQNSGAYGKNSNRGGDDTGVWTGGTSVVFDGTAGYEYSQTFTPNNGQEIAGFNFRIVSADGKSYLVTNMTSTSTVYKTQTVTLGGMTFSVYGNEKGATISCSAIKNEVYITALTSNAVNRVAVTALPGGDTTVDKAYQTINRGNASEVTFTPKVNKAVTNVYITSGGETLRLSRTDKSGVLGEMTFTQTRTEDGRVKVATSRTLASWEVSCDTEDGYYNITVQTPNHVSSAQAGTKLVYGSDGLTVTYRVDGLASLKQVVITMNGKKYTADALDSKILCGPYAYAITHSSNTITIDIDYMQSDMVVSVEVEENSYKVTLTADKGCEPVKNINYVTKGSDLEVGFKPKNGYTIKKLTLKYNKQTYTVDNEDEYIKIGGNKNPVIWSSDGVVTLYLYSVSDDVTVSATTDVDNYIKVETTTDSHANIKIETKAPYKKDDAIKVSVYPDNKYKITGVTITSGKNVARIAWGDFEFKFNGKTNTVTYKDSTMSFTVSSPDNITINAVSASGTATSVVTPTQTPTQQTTDRYDQTGNTNATYKAYINGVGDRMFDPDGTFTRAQAVVMLSRIYNSGHADYSSKASEVYADIKASDWYASDIGFAHANGYLEVLDKYGVGFNPNMQITRAEAVALALRFAGVTPEKTSGTRFKDVSEMNRLIDYINTAYDRGYIQGKGNNQFGPVDALTRAEAVTMINRMVGRDKFYETTDYSRMRVYYNDVPTTHWAYNAIMEASIAHD